jgi:hypothetical protein
LRGSCRSGLIMVHDSRSGAGAGNKGTADLGVCAAFHVPKYTGRCPTRESANLDPVIHCFRSAETCGSGLFSGAS